jgi:nucleoside-diphosphate-sugar epimerase
VKAFVTGGSGYVGRNLIRHLLKRRDTVRALARSPGSARIVSDLGAEPAMGDLDDRGTLQQAMAGCDVVFHSAAEVSEWGPRALYWKMNVDGTRNALAAAQAAGVKTFVHVGTEAALCDGTPLIDVDATRRPRPRPSAWCATRMHRAFARSSCGRASSGATTTLRCSAPWLPR